MFALRQACEADAVAVIAMHDRCGPETRLHRWMGNTEAMPSAYLAHPSLAPTTIMRSSLNYPPGR